MERIRQISSAQEAVLAMKSEYSAPHWPYGLNSRGLARTAAVGLMKASLSWLVIDGGSGLPCHFFNSGLGSNRSTWLGAPSMNMKMTFLALAGSGGALGASGSVRCDAALALPPSRSASAMAPRPPAQSRKNNRRL